MKNSFFVLRLFFVSIFFLTFSQTNIVAQNSPPNDRDLYLESARIWYSGGQFVIAQFTKPLTKISQNLNLSQAWRIGDGAHRINVTNMFSKPGSKKEVWLKTERQLTTPINSYLIQYTGWGQPFALESSDGQAVPRTIASLPADATIANPATPQKPTISSITVSKTTVEPGERITLTIDASDPDKYEYDSNNNQHTDTDQYPYPSPDADYKDRGIRAYSWSSLTRIETVPPPEPRAGAGVGDIGLGVAGATTQMIGRARRPGSFTAATSKQTEWTAPTEKGEYKLRGSAQDAAGQWTTKTVTITVEDNNPTVSIVSDPGNDKIYGLGDVITIKVTYTQSVTVSNVPRIKIKMDPRYGEKWANYTRGSGSRSLQFDFTVKQPNLSTAGLAVVANSLQLNGGTIEHGAAGPDADLTHAGLYHDINHRVDWRIAGGQNAPNNPTVSIVSDPGNDKIYGLGDVITIKVTYTQSVTVNNVPRIKIKMDPKYGEKWANYARGSGSRSLQFDFTVKQPNLSTAGLAVVANSLQLNGGTIKHGAAGPDADLTHAGLYHDINHKVDWRIAGGQNAPTKFRQLTTTWANIKKQ